MEEESILHSLVTCQYAKQSWLLLLPGINFFEASNFNSWLWTVLSTVDSRKHAEIVMLCWSLWRSRNDLIWNQKSTSALKTVAAARQYLAQWKATQSRQFVTPLQPLLEGDGACTWVKPQPNKVKVSVDAAIFKDHPGVEAMAFKEALSWMEIRDWQDATVETDCLSVVKAIRSQVVMRSYFGSIIE
ncbi:uncharacterized protein LOC141659705 [Apium graveolens]|uniref:uncharacterized protein LOC141659705 n=1 Tax=Apium graveolens TaxID=4045 RepID=UPI003D7C0AAA